MDYSSTTSLTHLVHLLLQTAVSYVGPQRRAVVTVPLSVLIYRHRAWVCYVEQRPPGLLRPMGCDGAEKTKISGEHKKLVSMIFKNVNSHLRIF